jgi:hypothetical protein
MTGAETAGIGLCANCGATRSGKFCSTCGAPAADAPASPHHEGWGGITNELLSSHGSNGIFSVALVFLRHPVATIMRLTDDPTYRSHWGFLTAAVGAQLTLVYVLLPRIFSALFHTPDTANSGAVITNEVVQYVGMVILTPIQYYVCRALGTVKRSPLSYVKLCVLSVSYGALLAIVVALAFFAIGIFAAKTGTLIDLAALWQGLVVATMVAILIFVAASHRLFWGLSWPVAVGFSLGVAVLSWGVVYPALTSLADRANITGTLGSFFG